MTGASISSLKTLRAAAPTQTTCYLPLLLGEVVVSYTYRTHNTGLCIYTKTPTGFNLPIWTCSLSYTAI